MSGWQVFKQLLLDSKGQGASVGSVSSQPVTSAPDTVSNKDSAGAVSAADSSTVKSLQEQVRKLQLQVGRACASSAAWS